MKYTTNYNLKKPEGADTVNIDDLNDNADILDNNINSLKEQITNLAAYAAASGTNSYTATIAGITALTEGFSIKIKFTNANTGASTLNINGLGAKSILKGNGNALSSGNIKAGQICNLVYNGSNFQLLGEGGEYGTATAPDVLAGKTIGTDNGLVEGTIPSKGASTIIPGTVNKIITAGQYLSGEQIIEGDQDLIPTNIKSGVNIFGISGTAPIPSGNAIAGDVLLGKSFSNNSTIGLNGSMPNNGAINSSITNQGGQYIIPAGYHNGSGKITANIPASSLFHYETITTSGSYIVPAGVTKLFVWMCGGGASGGSSSGGNGGGSGRVSFFSMNVTPGQVIAAVIGAGGIAPNIGVYSGGIAGGATSFGNATVRGGDIGTEYDNNYYGGAGGAGGGGGTNGSGGSNLGGYGGSGATLSSGGSSADSSYGRAGGAGQGIEYIPTGGTCPFNGITYCGGGGGGVDTTSKTPGIGGVGGGGAGGKSSPGGNGTLYGAAGGGAGGGSTYRAGNGYQGVVFVGYYA